MFVPDIPHNGCVQALVQILNSEKPYLNFRTCRIEFEHGAVLVNVLLCLYKTYNILVAVQASI